MKAWALLLVLLSLHCDALNIAIVSPYSWSTPGGVNVHVSGLAEALKDRGHQVTILAPADGAVPDGVINLGPTVPVAYNGSVARIAVGPIVVNRLYAALDEIRPDVIHIHEPFSPGASLLALFGSKCATVGTFHMGSKKCHMYTAFSPILTPLWDKLNARICVSPVAKATVEQSFSGTISLIPNGIITKNFSKVGSPPKQPTIAFIGRLEERKGAKTLVQALPYLVASVPDVKVFIAGDGPERKSLEAMVPPELQSHIQFLGKINDVADLASQSSVFCMPSMHGESFGIVLLEAMASGRPVVASDIPSYRAVLGEGSAFLTPPGNAEDLSAALTNVLQDPKLARKMGSAGRREVMSYDWGNLVARVEAVYESAIKSHRENENR